MAQSASSRALDALLERKGEAATAIQAKVHRTVLWRYRSGKGKPDAVTVALLERLSDGEVPAGGWEDLPAEDQGSGAQSGASVGGDPEAA